jgi:uncharacterized protein (UPF0332 family)
MSEEAKSISKFRLEQAFQDYEAAKLLYENKLFSQSVNRSYYSIFYSVKALLAYLNKDSKKHSGVIFLFYDNFIKTGKIEKEYNKILISAEKIRIDSDYKTFYVVSRVDAKKQLDNAYKFYNTINKYIIDNYF